MCKAILWQCPCCPQSCRKLRNNRSDKHGTLRRSKFHPRNPVGEAQENSLEWHKTHVSILFLCCLCKDSKCIFFPFVGSLTLLCLMGKEHTSYNISVFYYRDRIGQHNHNLHNMPAAVEKQSFQKKAFCASVLCCHANQHGRT